MRKKRSERASPLAHSSTDLRELRSRLKTECHGIDIQSEEGWDAMQQHQNEVGGEQL